jgi:hypothetical protein
MGEAHVSALLYTHSWLGKWASSGPRSYTETTGQLDVPVSTPSTHRAGPRTWLYALMRSTNAAHLSRQKPAVQITVTLLRNEARICHRHLFQLLGVLTPLFSFSYLFSKPCLAPRSIGSPHVCNTCFGDATLA